MLKRRGIFEINRSNNVPSIPETLYCASKNQSRSRSKVAILKGCSPRIGSGHMRVVRKPTINIRSCSVGEAHLAMAPFTLNCQSVVGERQFIQVHGKGRLLGIPILLIIDGHPIPSRGQARIVVLIEISHFSV